MRLRLRTMILAVALLLTTATSSANFLDPFHWGNYNNGYGAYPGYDPAYAHHYGTYRLIDDWLGYGYLRNQEGTYGHYPFRGWNWGGLGGGSNWNGGWDLGVLGWNWDWGWGLNPGGLGWNWNWGGRIGCPDGGYGSQFYQPSYPGLLNPGVPAAAFAPPVAAMPVAPPMQYAAPMSMGDLCCDPCMDCCDPCMGASVMQMPVPVTTWRPVTVDRGSWQRVWVPRPVTTMVPQTQFMMPQASMMPMTSGCDECGGMATPMIHGDVMQGSMMPGMTTESGCCGGGESVASPEMTTPVQQQTMMFPGYSTGYAAYPQMAINQYPMTHAIMSGWTPQSTWAHQPQWTPQAQWAPQSAWTGNPYMAQSAMRPGMYRRMVRQMTRQYGSPIAQNRIAPNAMYSTPVAQMPNYGWQTMSAPQMGMSFPAQYPSAYPATAYSAPVYNMAPVQSAWIQQGTPTVMSPGATMIDPAMNSLPVAGDIMGDHEVVAPATAGVPIIPNSFQGNAPVMRANLPRTIGVQSANRYPQVVR